MPLPTISAFVIADNVWSTDKSLSKMCLSFAGMDESDKRRIKNCKQFTEERGRLLLYTGFLVRYTCLYFINIYDVFSIMYGSGGGVLDTTLCDKDCQ